MIRDLLKGTGVALVTPFNQELSVDYDALQRVINFVVGVRPLGYEPAINTSRGSHLIRSARRANDHALFGETWLDDRTVRLPFVDGTVEFTLA